MPLVVLKPDHVRPILKPVVEPVLKRLERQENLIVEIKATLDVQFQRIAAIQAQLDHLLARLRTSS